MVQTAPRHAQMTATRTNPTIQTATNATTAGIAATGSASAFNAAAAASHVSVAASADGTTTATRTRDGSQNRVIEPSGRRTRTKSAVRSAVDTEAPRSAIRRAAM